MKKTMRRYDHSLKISLVAEPESDKPLAHIAREHGIHPMLPTRWRNELAENPEKAFSRNWNKFDDQARIAELDRLIGQPHTEINLFKESLCHDPKEGPAVENKTDSEGRIIIIHKTLSAGRLAALGVVQYLVKTITELIYDKIYAALNNLDISKIDCMVVFISPILISCFRCIALHLIFGGFNNHACLF